MMDKKKLYIFSRKFLTRENIKILILLIPLTILITKEIRSGTFIIDDFSDTSIIISFFSLFICDTIAKILFNFIASKTEDATKLTTNYSDLIERYSSEKSKLVKIPNIRPSSEQQNFLPEIILSTRKLSDLPYSFSIEPIVDSIKNINKFVLPEQIASNAEAIFHAHQYSSVYNNINIRLKDFKSEGPNVWLNYEFTTYFDSLLTNRAMDYPFKTFGTIRDLYEPGPIINPLNQSKLSNHLGFNGFVKIKDGFIFVRRDSKLSIGKKTWATSIGASLKTKYCLDTNSNFTVYGICNAIRNEIKDELKIQVDEKYNLVESIFAFYRDLVEGGKPQFLFYYSDDSLDKSQFESNFKRVQKNKVPKSRFYKNTEIDGKIFVYFTEEQLRKAEFSNNSLIIEGKKYAMMPSAIASVVLLLNAIS